MPSELEYCNLTPSISNDPVPIRVRNLAWLTLTYCPFILIILYNFSLLTPPSMCRIPYITQFSVKSKSELWVLWNITQQSHRWLRYVHWLLINLFTTFMIKHTLYSLRGTCFFANVDSAAHISHQKHSATPQYKVNCILSTYIIHPL
jgi:hypothetical protein